MKTVLKIGVFVFVLSFFGLTGFTSAKVGVMHTENQEENRITGVYDGHEDYGYNFIYKLSDGKARTMTFQEAEADVLKAHDLDSESLIGMHFGVIYTISKETLIDENDFEEEIETKTITKLYLID